MADLSSVIIGASAAILGGILTATANYLFNSKAEQERLEKAERKEAAEQIEHNKMLVDRSLNKALVASIRITEVGAYDKEHGGEEAIFDSQRYISDVRPHLYEHFDLLEAPMREKINQIDVLLEARNVSDVGVEYKQSLKNHFIELSSLIKARYGLPVE